MIHNGTISTAHVVGAPVVIQLLATPVANGAVLALNASTGSYSFQTANDALVSYFTVQFLVNGAPVSRGVVVFEGNVIAPNPLVHTDSFLLLAFACAGTKTVALLPGTERNGAVMSLSAAGYTFSLTDPTLSSGFEAAVFCDGARVGVLAILIPYGSIPPTPITLFPPFLDALAAGLTYQRLWFTRNDIVHNTDAEAYAGNRSDLRYSLEIFTPPYPLANTFARITNPLDMAENPPKQVGSITTYEGAVYFIQQYLDDYVAWNPPKFNQTGFRVETRHTVPFYLKSTVKPTNTTETTGIEWAFKGGIDDEDFSDYGLVFFDKYLAQSRRFLTWCPDDKVVSAAQPEYLSFLLNFTPLPTAVRLRVRVHYADNTWQIRTPSDTTTLPMLRNYYVLNVAVGHDALGFDLLPQKVLAWEVWLANEQNQRISEIRTYRQDFEYRHQERFVVFANSLGGYDTYRFTGQSAQKQTARRLTYKRDKSYFEDASVPEILVSEVNADRGFVAYTGWLDKKANLRWLQELLLSEDIYWATDRLMRPMMLSTSELMYDQDEENRIGRVFDFTFTNRHNNYSALPQGQAPAARPMAWRGTGQANCELDGRFLRTGRAVFTTLELYYADDNSIVRPRQFKPNDPADADYIAPATGAGSCANTPSTNYHVNAALSGLGRLPKNNCAAGQVGLPATISVAAGRWGGYDPTTGQDTQATADARAQAEFEGIDTQANANANGSCIAPVVVECEGPVRGMVAAALASNGLITFPTGNPTEILNIPFTLPVAKVWTIELAYYNQGGGQLNAFLDGVSSPSVVLQVPQTGLHFGANAAPPATTTASLYMTAGSHVLAFASSGSAANAATRLDKIRFT